jgi:hypothetical protein
MSACHFEKLNDEDKILVNVLMYSWLKNIKVGCLNNEWSKVHEALNEIFEFLDAWYKKEPNEETMTSEHVEWCLDLKYLISIVWRSNIRSFVWNEFGMINGFGPVDDNIQLKTSELMYNIVEAKDDWSKFKSLNLLSKLFRLSNWPDVQFSMGCCKCCFEEGFFEALIHLLKEKEQRHYIYLISKNREIILHDDVMKHINSFLPSQVSVTFDVVSILKYMRPPLKRDLIPACISEWIIVPDIMPLDIVCFRRLEVDVSISINKAQSLTEAIMKINDFKATISLCGYIGWLYVHEGVVMIIESVDV